MGRRSVGDRSDQSAGEKLAAKQMRLFSAAAVSLALLALGNGASLAQSAPPLLGVIGQTSPLGPPFGATGNDVRGPASQNSPLPYSGVPTPGMAMPCAMANPGTSGLPTFDGGGFTPSVGTTMSGMPAGASSPAGATQIPCPTVSTSGITPTANGNVASTLTSAAATSGSVANTSPAAAPNSSPNTVVQGVAALVLQASAHPRSERPASAHRPPPRHRHRQRRRCRRPRAAARHPAPTHRQPE
jgi:hypothetical protein